jgi:hypothetical protein
VTEARLPVITIDGASIDDFAGFVDAFAVKLDDFEWHGSLDAFNDILRGGCGTPDGGFELRLLNSARLRRAWAGQQRSAGWKGRW